MKTFINLPVKDLPKTVAFFTELGFAFDERFTDENATCMIISEDSYAMLLVEPMFQGFTSKAITDTSKASEVIVGLSVDSREQLDDLFAKAVAAGATDLGGDDQGFMYMRGFSDLDGHQWSFIYMDMTAVPEQ